MLDQISVSVLVNDTLVQTAMVIATSLALSMTLGSRVPSLCACPSSLGAPGLAGRAQPIASFSGAVALATALAASNVGMQILATAGWPSYAIRSGKQFVRVTAEGLAGGKSSSTRRRRVL